MHGTRLVLVSFIALVVTGMSPAVGHAGTAVAGAYRCWSYNVSGGGGSCRMAPPLVLHPDGTYQMSSEQGTYTVSGDHITLSASTLRGPGRMQHGHQIVFTYLYRGWQHTITYRCQDCAGR